MPSLRILYLNTKCDFHLHALTSVHYQVTKGAYAHLFVHACGHVGLYARVAGPPPDHSCYIINSDQICFVA